MRAGKLVIVVAIALVVIAAAFGGYYYFYKNKQNSSEKMRQAVFLSNGQVYFGYVTGQNTSTVELEQIYYLKTQDLLQSNADNNSKKIALVKLGSELHGPTDKMKISLNQILYIESMRRDSKINQAIEKFNSQNQ